MHLNGKMDAHNCLREAPNSLPSDQLLFSSTLPCQASILQVDSHEFIETC